MTARRRLSSLRALVAFPGLLAGAGLLGVVGCATVPPPPREAIAPEAREIIEVLARRWRDFTTLRTLADVVVQRGGERQQARAVLLARAPASLRFEALSPMGSPLLVATIHEGRLVAYDATTNEALVGPATPATTARVLGLPFEPGDLVAVLGGRPHAPPDLRVARLVADDETGPSIELVGEVNRRRIWFEPSTGVVRQFELTGGRTEARVRFHRTPTGEPTGFDLTTVMSYVSASVRYQTPVFDAPVDPDLFSFEPPKDAKIQEIR